MLMKEADELQVGDKANAAFHYFVTGDAILPLIVPQYSSNVDLALIGARQILNKCPFLIWDLSQTDDANDFRRKPGLFFDIAGVIGQIHNHNNYYHACSEADTPALAIVRGFCKLFAEDNKPLAPADEEKQKFALDAHVKNIVDKHLDVLAMRIDSAAAEGYGSDSERLSEIVKMTLTEAVYDALGEDPNEDKGAIDKPESAA